MRASPPSLALLLSSVFLLRPRCMPRGPGVEFHGRPALFAFPLSPSSLFFCLAARPTGVRTLSSPPLHGRVRGIIAAHAPQNHSNFSRMRCTVRWPMSLTPLFRQEASHTPQGCALFSLPAFASPRPPLLPPPLFRSCSRGFLCGCRLPGSAYARARFCLGVFSLLVVLLLRRPHALSSLRGYSRNSEQPVSLPCLGFPRSL